MSTVQADIEHLKAEIARLHGLIQQERQERVASIASLEGQISTGMATIRTLLEQLNGAISLQDLTMQKLFTELKVNVAMLSDRDRLKDDQLLQLRGQMDNLTTQISALTTISAENAASVGVWHGFRRDMIDLFKGLSVKVDEIGKETGMLRLEFTRLVTKSAVEARFERRDQARIQAVLRFIREIITPKNLILILSGAAAFGVLAQDVVIALQNLLQ